MTETQQRFLRAIAERVPAERIVELHLFPSIRQGGVETGVAVVAEQPQSPVVEPEAPVEPVEGSDPHQTDDRVAEPEARGATVAAPERLTIHTARYRLTLKGVDRGKWEVDVVAEADAPLDAVDAVVRGVQRRAGEDAEPGRLSTEELREALDAPLATLER